MKNEFKHVTPCLCLKGEEMAIRKRGKSFEVRVPTNERYPNGRKKEITETCSSKEEAKQKEKELYKKLQDIYDHVTSPKEIQPDDHPFNEAAHDWLMGMKREVKETTYNGYLIIVDKYLIPYYKNISIREISKKDVLNYYHVSHLSGKTLQQHHSVLKRILESANSNVMKEVSRPKAEKKEIQCIRDPEELEKFILSFRGTNMYLPALIAAITGMRFSEIAGLKWADIVGTSITISRSLHWFRDEVTGEKYYMEKPPKNTASYRTISVNPEGIEEILKFRNEAKSGDYICFDSSKNPINRENLGSNFRDAARSRGYEISFHGLRHSHATILLQVFKESTKTVSRRLGHADVSITLQVYVGYVPEDDKGCADAMSSIFNPKKKIRKGVHNNKFDGQMTDKSQNFK